jgi:hypothetical protein
MVAVGGTPHADSQRAVMVNKILKFFQDMGCKGIK